MKLIVDVDRDADTMSVSISDSKDYRPDVLNDWCARALEVINAQRVLADDSAPD